MSSLCFCHRYNCADVTLYGFVAFPRFAGMGNLLKVLSREIENNPHFFLDFESKFKEWNVIFSDLGRG